MSAHNSRTSETAEDHRYSEICGATNRNGNPCKLPKGWGTPGSGGTRCKYHGGLSSGPDDTSHLQDNNFAADNDGGAPTNNDNAAIHGGFSDWRTVYERFRKDPAARQRIETLVSAYLHTAQEHATDVDLDRRKELARELATRRVLTQRAQEDVWSDDNTDADADADADTDTDARGLLIEDDTGHGGGRSTPRTSQRINTRSEPVRLLRNCHCGRGFNSPRTSPGVVTIIKSGLINSRSRGFNDRRRLRPAATIRNRSDVCHFTVIQTSF